MDIKDTQNKIKGTIDEIIKLVTKKMNHTNDTTSSDSIIKNINHQIYSWEKYVLLYIDLDIQPLTKYDIDIITMILYIFKTCAKIINYQLNNNNYLFMDNYVLKDTNIIRENIEKINSVYNFKEFVDLNQNLNFKRLSNDEKKVAKIIIEFIDTNIIEYQLNTIIK